MANAAPPSTRNPRKASASHLPSRRGRLGRPFAAPFVPDFWPGRFWADVWADVWPGFWVGLWAAFLAPPDEEAFPCLALARAAGEAGRTMQCVLNAANEVAVGAFLDGRLPFLAISEVVERTLNEVEGRGARDLDDLTAVDEEARRVASAHTRQLVH